LDKPEAGSSQMHAEGKGRHGKSEGLEGEGAVGHADQGLVGAAEHIRKGLAGNRGQWSTSARAGGVTGAEQ
jgi:hypothetical protein